MELPSHHVNPLWEKNNNKYLKDTVILADYKR